VTDSAGQKLAYVYFEDAGPSLSDRPRVFLTKVKVVPSSTSY